MQLVTAGIDTIKLVAYSFERVADIAPRQLGRHVFGESGEVAEQKRWPIGAGNVGYNSAAPNSRRVCDDRRKKLGARHAHGPECGCGGMLWFEVSAPKLIYAMGAGGSKDVSNLRLAPPETVHEIAAAATEAAMQAAGYEVSPAAWKIGRLDVAADFEAAGTEGRSIIYAAERVRFARMTPGAWGHGETAMHINGARTFRVYDKAVEAGLAFSPRGERTKLCQACAGNQWLTDRWDACERCDGTGVVPVAADEAAVYQPGERVRFEAQARFDKQARGRAWDLKRNRAGLQLYEPVASLCRVSPTLQVGGPQAWVEDLARHPELWQLKPDGTPRRYAHAYYDRIVSTATTLSALGRVGLLNARGRDAGYRALRELRDAGFWPAGLADLEADNLPAGERPPCTVIDLDSVRRQIGQAFNIVPAERAA